MTVAATPKSKKQPVKRPEYEAGATSEVIENFSQYKDLGQVREVAEKACCRFFLQLVCVVISDLHVALIMPCFNPLLLPEVWQVRSTSEEIKQCQVRHFQKSAFLCTFRSSV